jgi:hypothetical protein
MRIIIAAVVLIGSGCEGTVELEGSDADALSDVAWQLCTGNPAPECDDGDPCTFDLCNDAHPCGSEDCADADEGPAICWHLPLDVDSDGYATAAGECGARGEPFVDCDDGNAEVRPGWPEVCDTLDNDCDGFTDEDCP